MNNFINYVSFHHSACKDLFTMTKSVWFLAVALTVLPAAVQADGLRFALTYTSDGGSRSVDGRMLLLISADSTAEPRFQIGEGPETQLIFGLDVDGLKPNEPAVIDRTVFGFPVKSIADIPAGWYWVQGVLHKYETFRRADGHIVKLPMDRGEGQQWNQAPGNLYSAPRKVWIDPAKDEAIGIALDKTMPPIEPPKDTKYLKHISIQSERLTKFWGRPMVIGASILLPEGFDTHPDARYPLMVEHGHFSSTFEGFAETMPDTAAMKGEYSERFKLENYNKIEAAYAYELYKDWTSPGFPRVVVVELQHANPYYDDSYAVNSENLGPYGDAVMYELIPAIEKKFRCIGAGWARSMYGGSTGGWEALAVQIFYPDEFNGCFAACPDPLDFRAYTVVNIYQDSNAYYIDSRWKKTPRPATRHENGIITATLEDANHLELARGTHGRSGEQWDIWQAVFGPVGSDGYPKPIWDKMTGTIDRTVADYWREHYDLCAILRRDWKELGPKLEGKIHLYCGEADDYYLNNSVHLIEDFLKTTKHPFYGGEVDYEARAGHCWNGDHTRPNAISRLRYAQMFIPRAVDRMLKTAPEGADTTSWRY
jgi:hypothetical protein